MRCNTEEIEIDVHLKLPFKRCIRFEEFNDLPALFSPQYFHGDGAVQQCLVCRDIDKTVAVWHLHRW